MRVRSLDAYASGGIACKVDPETIDSGAVTSSFLFLGSRNGLQWRVTDHTLHRPDRRLLSKTGRSPNQNE